VHRRSHVIEWHLKKIQASEIERLAFFYCSRTQGQRTLPLDVFRSFVAQLAWSTDGSSIAKSVKTAYGRRKDCQLSLDECSNLLVGLVERYKRTTIVVDALDECENSTSLLLHLKKLWDSVHGVIKFFFSSRKNVDLPENFLPCEKLDLDSQRSLTEEDMMMYVRSQVEEREKLGLGTRLLKGKKPELEERLIETLVRRAQGM